MRSLPFLLRCSIERLAAQPLDKLSHLRGLVPLRVELEKWRQTLNRQEWKRGARLGGAVTSARLPHIDPQRPALEAPDLGNTQCHVDAGAIERAARDIDLDRQIGRRIPGEIDLLLAAHLLLVRDPVTLVRLQTALQVLALESGRASAADGDAELVGQHLD